MEPQTELRPIPAYYCCYLLRSTVRHASLYIGSTPNPIRRLSQHNGDAKGGAKRTARDKLRPWEMVLVVEGFMSRVGALQFEWAWQHPDRTRHVHPENRDGDDEQPQSKVTINPKTGKTRPRPGRSRRSLTAHLEDLHALLRSTYFSSWPLKVRFFCADVHRVWRVWNDRVGTSLPDDRVIRDGDCSPSDDNDRVGSTRNLSVDYAKIEGYLEKSMFILDDPDDLRCGICKDPVKPTEQQILVCPQAVCRGTSHLLCLSSHFLESHTGLDTLVPSHGSCPTCKETVQWPLMVQELSLRNRAEKEARLIVRRKERRERKESAKASSSQVSPKKATGYRDASVEPTSTLANSDPLLDDDWCEKVDLESDTEFSGGRHNLPPPSPTKLEVVIEDSDWDDAELVE